MKRRHLSLTLSLLCLVTCVCSTLHAQKPKIRLKLKPNTKVVAKNMIGAVGDEVPVKAFLYSIKAGKKVPLKGKTLFFKIGKFNVGRSVTDGKGKAAIKYKVPTTSKKRKILVTFKGGDGLMPAKGEATFTFFKASTEIFLVDTHLGSGGRHFSGRLRRKTDKKSLQGRRVHAFVNGKSMASAKTNINGKFRLAFRPPTPLPKPFIVTLRFKGESVHLPTAFDYKFKAPPPPKTEAFLTVPNIKGKTGHLVVTRALLSKSKFYHSHQGIANQTIWLYRERTKNPKYKKKKFAKGKTDRFGVAKIAFRLDEDAFNYSVDAYVEQSPKNTLIVRYPRPSRKLIVSPGDLNVIVRCNLKTVKIGQKARFTIFTRRIPDGKGVPVHVNFASCGFWETSKHGIVTFLHKIRNKGGTGKRMYKVSFGGNKRYNPASGHVWVNVIP